MVTRSEKYYDLTGTITYIAITLVALLSAEDLNQTRVIVGAMVLAWTSRLGVFLFGRIRKAGHDRRFAKILTDPLRLAVTWALQALWAYLTAACALAVITSTDDVSFGVFAVVGLLIWIVGFGIEVVADTQKSAFRADPTNEGRFISTGLWAWSRHPNYFGEIVLWIGMAVIALPVLSGSRLVMLISPVFVYLLLNYVSGVPMLERRAQKVWGDDADYQAYKASTPVLVMRPPRA